MTKDAAIRWACNRARKARTDIYVVWSVEEQDAPGQHYHTANDEDVEGFYMGSEVVACVQPDGTVTA